MTEVAYSTTIIFENAAASTTTIYPNTAASTTTIVPSAAASTTVTDLIATTADSSDCSLFFDYVDIYYYPTAAPNTACLSGLPSASAGDLPSGFTKLYGIRIKLHMHPADSFHSQSPSVYLVIPTISAGNSNSQVGIIHTSVTMSFDEGQLSTIELPSRATNVFDLGDLPCPPASVASADWWLYNPSYNPDRPYRPLLSAPPGIFNIDPAWGNCVTAVNQGIDPPTALPTVTGLSGPDVRHGPPRMHRREPVHAHRVLQGPVETGSPS